MGREPSHAAVIERAARLHRLAYEARDLGRTAGAVRLGERAVRLLEARLGSRDAETVNQRLASSASCSRPTTSSAPRRRRWRRAGASAGGSAATWSGSARWP